MAESDAAIYGLKSLLVELRLTDAERRRVRKQVELVGHSIIREYTDAAKKIVREALTPNP